MKRLAAIALFPIAAWAQQTPVVPVPAPNIASVIFMDSNLFDNTLSKELSSGKDEVEITLTGKVSLNHMPGRIDKWITAVAEKGQVKLEPQEADLKPKFILSLIPVIYSFIKSTSAERLVEPANKYNASVVYHVDRSGESVIDRIVFSKKK